MDVDCGRLSYDSPISPTVQEAANEATKMAKGPDRDDSYGYDIGSLDLSMQMYLALETGSKRKQALENIFGKRTEDKTAQDNYKDCPSLSTISKKDLNRTLSPHESLCTSMLRHVDKKTISRTDLEEAFCRDIDSFNAAYIVSCILFQSPLKSLCV